MSEDQKLLFRFAELVFRSSLGPCFLFFMFCSRPFSLPSYNIVISELSHIPLLNGIMFLQWKVGRTEGYSPHFPVKEHSIAFNMSFHLEQYIDLNRVTNVLEDVPLRIRVNQETEGGQEWTRFGSIHLNLSEFAGSRQTTRKFLLEKSKTNAALSISVFSVLKSGGSPFFKVPDSAKKFVMLEEEDDDVGHQGKEGFRAHALDDTLMSDQRFMVRERENLRLPPNITSTREDNSEIVDEILAKVFSGVDF